jgi:lysozyme
MTAADLRLRAALPATEKAAGVGTVALMIACLFTAQFEGKENTTYVDKLGRGQPLTYCYGSTVGAVWGRRYTDAECLQALLRDSRRHAEAIQPYLPPNLPDKTAAAFYDFGYNLFGDGAAFGRTSVSRKALAGDLPGACRAMGLYFYANKKDCRIAANKCSGIIRRRTAETKLCLEGLQ